MHLWKQTHLLTSWVWSRLCICPWSNGCSESPRTHVDDTEYGISTVICQLCSIHQQSDRPMEDLDDLGRTSGFIMWRSIYRIKVSQNYYRLTSIQQTLWEHTNRSLHHTLGWPDRTVSWVQKPCFIQRVHYIELRYIEVSVCVRCPNKMTCWFVECGAGGAFAHEAMDAPNHRVRRSTAWRSGRSWLGR